MSLTATDRLFITTTVGDAIAASEQRLAEIFSDAMQMISERFDKQDATFARADDMHVALNRIENKIDATIHLTDDHEI